MFFWATGDFEGFRQDFALHRLLAQPALQLLHLGLERRYSEAGTTSSSAAVAVSAPWDANLRQANNWFG